MRTNDVVHDICCIQYVIDKQLLHSADNWIIVDFALLPSKNASFST